MIKFYILNLKYFINLELIEYMKNDKNYDEILAKCMNISKAIFLQNIRCK